MATAARKSRPAASRGKKPPNRLERYRAKRDFTRTAEPQGGAPSGTAAAFVIQKHAASRLHFDFRLEMEGVLKSWAVPKGIPLEPGEKHLAVMVEDHPIDYGGFEGTIPKGEYGGGTVMLWDRGSYRVGGGDPVRALQEGKLHLFLEGEKLRGEWALVRLRGKETEWLLLKAGEPMKPQARQWDRSAASGRSMEEIAGAADVPSFVEPMKAKPASQPPEGAGWLFELKFDGFRFLGGKGGGGGEGKAETRLWSRSENDFTARFPKVAEAVGKLKAKSALIDGELVVADEEGRPSFQLIQNADAKTPVRAFVFDLLELEGKSWRHKPLVERRAKLAEILPARSSLLHFSQELTGPPQELLKQVAERGLEGLIAKRRDSAYEPGRRSGAWLKIKCQLEQEFVIGGFTAPRGGRSHFGALLIGYYDGKALRFAGKVGTGFTQKSLVALHRAMTALRIAQPPFTKLPGAHGRWGAGFSRAELARCTWVEPRLVAQIHFTEWTDEGILRHPALLGLREDKEAREVVRET